MGLRVQQLRPGNPSLLPYEMTVHLWWAKALDPWGWIGQILFDFIILIFLKGPNIYVQ